jgi:D-amino peptidase
MKILMMTDLEGVAGILNFEDWCTPEGSYYDKAKRLLTREVNAAAKGLFGGGVEEILVIDGHGHGAIDPELLDERLLLMRGHAERVVTWGLDETYDGVAYVGQHARASTPYSHLTHTQGWGYVDLAVNGVSIGEFGQLVLCAKELGIPTVFASGEQAFAEEAEDLTPGVITVAVKRGLLPDGLEHVDADTYSRSKLSAVHLAPERSRKLIRKAARKAARKLKKNPEAFSYRKLDPPYVRTARFRQRGDSPGYETRDEHPSSLIDLLGSPYTRVE